MKNKFLKVGVLVLSVSSVVTGGVCIWKIKKSVELLKPALPDVYAMTKLEKKNEHGTAVAKTEGHGGGHGEAPKAESGHGGGHGAKEADRAPASQAAKGVPLFSVDELFVNVNSENGSHMMALKLELELFESESRELIKSRHSGVRDRIIEISRGFDYSRLNTLGGKLYFKESIVGTLNEFFGQAIIKNAHISSLYLQ